jgi:hypothetical protein
MTDSVAPKSAKLNIVLWVIQVLLALLYLWAGSIKLVLPLEQLKGPGPEFPGWFLRLIGVLEVVAGLGLILPGLLGIKTGLTVIAAAGIVIIMIGATVVGLMSGGIAFAILPLVCGLLAAFVAYGRWRLAPLRSTRS